MSGAGDSDLGADAAFMVLEGERIIFMGWLLVELATGYWLLATGYWLLATGN
jgi:hypothetical protein